MKIAQIANIAESVPPKKYGGTERIVSVLTEELVRRGHEVTLFASGDSVTSAKLASIYPTSLREATFSDPYGLNPLALQNIGMAYQKQQEFDIIHDHNWLINMPGANLATTPVVMTVHGEINLYNRGLFESMSNINYVTISKAQQMPLPHIKYAGVVHHGLPMETYPFGEEHEGYLLYVGRIAREKGVHHAIDVAKFMHMPLIIAAKLDVQEESYFKEMIEPQLNQAIRWVGEVNEEERNKLMSKAYAFLHPVEWREPFGLTLIEAMACGTPVIAFRHGSIPEIIQNGKTGFIVEDVNEMVVAVSKLDQISREYCRKYAMERFTVKRMVDGYEAIYQELIDKRATSTTKLHKKYESDKLKLQENTHPLHPMLPLHA